MATTQNTDPRITPLLLALGAVLGAMLVSGVSPHDRLTWFMEVFPVMVAVSALVFTFKKFPLTTVLYCGIFLHALVLIMGGAYTYARVPLGFEIAELLNISRNPYDKIGHFMQGLVPALLAREILMRGVYVRTRGMLFFLVTCTVLAFSAFYELIEWWAALAMGGSAEDFLGLQGYEWDTQSDMFYALCGAIFAQLVFGPLQAAQIRRLSPQGPPA